MDEQMIAFITLAGVAIAYPIVFLLIVRDLRRYKTRRIAHMAFPMLPANKLNEDRSPKITEHRLP